MKKLKDILIVGRPDHSLQIYDSLCHQKKLSFLFITFKVLPTWLRKLITNKKIRYVGRNSKISIWLTLINICRFSFNFSFAKNWDEANKLGPLLKKALKKADFKIVHYWLNYADKDITNYLKLNKNVIGIKDIHMPSFLCVYQSMKEVSKKYNLDISNYKNEWEIQKKELKGVKNVLVPSRYVLNSYKEYFPEINFYLVSYGITVWKNYKKKSHITENHKFKFVYVGRISLEKGCDILFEYFGRHPEYELHVFGSMVESQKTILQPMKTSNIIFHGVIPKSQLQKEITNYDIGIHLSRFDAYSLGVGEIIGCGIPVIVSNTTGNEEDVLNFGLGVVTDNSVEDIEKKVKNITNINIYNSFVESIDRYIQNDSTPFGDKMVEFYEKLIKSN